MQILQHSLMITSFVLIMMLLIEYVNVQTHGSWQAFLQKSRWGQYILAAALGATPGCLGAFAVVSLYSHRIVSFGSLVGAMIATSGDEAFVMFSMFPQAAFVLTAITFAAGILAAFLTDLLWKKQDRLLEQSAHALELHQREHCNCFPRGEILQQLRNMTFPRALLIGFLGLFIFALFTLEHDHGRNWVWLTFLAGSIFSLFVVSTVPEHFLKEHIWKHVVRKHLPRIFLWTFGSLLAIHVLDQYMDLQAWVQTNTISILLLACLVGLIPESGPHLVFVTLYARGMIPLSILLASSVVQDGHGTLPLLAVSKRAFVILKAINLLFGLGLGILALLLGW